jgi:hypothetical protein
MILLRDKETGATLAELTPAELQILIDAFEEEGRDDRDYWIDATSPEYLESNFPGSARVARLLRAALNGREGFDVEWERQYADGEAVDDDDSDELDESV